MVPMSVSPDRAQARVADEGLFSPSRSVSVSAQTQSEYAISVPGTQASNYSQPRESKQRQGYEYGVPPAGTSLERGQAQVDRRSAGVSPPSSRSVHAASPAQYASGAPDTQASRYPRDQVPQQQRVHQHDMSSGGAVPGRGQARVDRGPAAESPLPSSRSVPAASHSRSPAEVLPNGSSSAPISDAETIAPQSPSLKIHFTEQAKQQLADLERSDPRYRGRAREMHEEAIMDYAKEHKPKAKRANVRKVAHTGGMNPTEGEHQTVSFKGGPGEDGNGVHIPMPPRPNE
ncbi:uncharacterized protein PHACADRAFT_258925 [Phanerochaete carnosa HHB-10118-sp]|uniref:Uncharacterized protein n=1 Tax=Phanerochaete carnosa (strain HHB-10118-sp) TaxID=650164 RepID=K5W789_PHACS|nr:uncharacterized protein PHACADRAFT_258925 [Phanerochaete carnosa HHB-10118-sp]EKM54809.1 hypothetical protein PHACADRAFT_258925 [Phanerochaete carnosa HHB-10118-sp]